MKILTAEQMRSIDRRATEQFGIPSILLMENAAMAVADVITSHYPDVERASIICGTGQNGGDGLAVARLLENRGIIPSIIIVGERGRFDGDARTNLTICERLGLLIDDATDSESLDRALARASENDLIVDALFGTGLNRPPEGIHAEAIRGLANLRLPIVAIDIPSGLDASGRTVAEPVVHADVTVTFGQPKIAHIFDPAATYCGEIIVADISIPHSALEAENVTLSLVTPRDVQGILSARPAEVHKGTYGHLAMIAGSPGKSGASILAARGALRGGTGLVTVITDPDTASIIDSVSIESMTLPVALGKSSMKTILDQIGRSSALLIGPGLADHPESYAFIRELLSQVELPAVLDATAINAFAGEAEALNPLRRPRIITPHPGELGRLLGRKTNEINEDRVEIARTVAAKTGTIVILKGHQSIVADPGGQVAVNPTGNPGMATGGMGDVLAGLVAGFVAQRHDLFEACCAATYLHGFAGDIVRHERSEIGMTAMEVADAIPTAIEKIRNQTK